MTRIVAMGCAVLALMLASAGWAFEGSMQLRTTAVERDQLSKLNGGKAPDTEQTLAILPSALLAAKDSGAQSRESMVYVSGSKVRMDTPMEQSADSYALVDTEKDLTVFVVPGEKRYIEWSAADAKAMGEKMAQLEKMMKERMNTLPPDQRAQVESMLKQMHADDEGGAPAKVDLKSTGKSQTINGMQTTGYEVKTGDETMVGWVTQDQPELAKMLQTVQSRMEKMTPPSLQGRQSARNALGLKGFPVMVQTVDPTHYRIEEVVTVEKKAVSPSLFEIPKDFTRTTGRDAMERIPDKLPED